MADLALFVYKIGLMKMSGVHFVNDERLPGPTTGAINGVTLD